MLAKNTPYKYRKQNSECNKILEKKKPRELPNVRKYRKSNKDFSCQLKHPFITRYNKIHDFGKEEAERDPEMSAKIAKVTRIFHAS